MKTRVFWQICLLLCVPVVLSANSPEPLMRLEKQQITVGQTEPLTLDFRTPQRGYMSEIVIKLPRGVRVSKSRTSVDVIGRGAVSLRDLPHQSLGRVASSYSVKTVGKVSVRRGFSGTKLIFKGIDLRADNGIDLRLSFDKVRFARTGEYRFEAFYVPGSKPLEEGRQGAAYVPGDGKRSEQGTVTLSVVKEQLKAPQFCEEEKDVRDFGILGDGIADDTDALNSAISALNSTGGGILYFPEGEYMLRTVHLLSNVWLHIGDSAVLKAIPGADPMEATWFVDYSPEAGSSLSDMEEKDNYLIKQDFGHSFFHNCMFFAQRAENVKIWGNGRISGNGVIETGNQLMNNPPERRCDKMFVFKLCRNMELGGIGNGKDLWYDEEADEPCYLEADGSHNLDVSNMLDIDQGGHFALLATGTDGLSVHDIYCGRNSLNRARDIFDFMECRDVQVTNIYSKVNGDDIVKLGSDCSLGFTRPAYNYLVRNIVGDTNCNLFQIGSETADDITDVYVDNLYVLATNKAGFSISTNDGGTVKNIYLNSAKTGPIRERSVMKRVRTPFFISISNRGRVLGVDGAEYTILRDGIEKKEILVTNSNIGHVENVVIKSVDIESVYAGSCYYNGIRWKEYDGTQPESSPIIAGFTLPDPDSFVGSTCPVLPDGRATGYIDGITFQDVNIKVLGGHPEEDASLIPPEIKIGGFNIRDLRVQPSFGFWARHAKNIKIEDCSLEAESPDGRYPILFDDVLGAEIVNLAVKPGSSTRGEIVHSVNSENVSLK